MRISGNRDVDLSNACKAKHWACWLYVGWNKSMFLDTDGSATWLYPCSMFLLPQRRPDKSYDPFSSLYEWTNKKVVPITCST